MWDTYSRYSIDLATSAASLGFQIAKGGTRIGFAVGRGVATTAVGVTGYTLDHALFGGNPVAFSVLGGAVFSALALAEQLALAPLNFGEYITSTSLLAAPSSINLLSLLFPGSTEASFSLASFITLVKREYNEPAFSETLPDKYRGFGVTKIARGLVAWVALQGVTQEYQETRWLKYLQEIRVEEAPKASTTRKRSYSRVRVTSDVTWSGNRGQIISADIGEAPRTRTKSSFAPPKPRKPLQSTKLSTITDFQTPWSETPIVPLPPQRMFNVELKATLRRLSKFVLAGYGGASLLFFGVSPQTPAPKSQASAAKAIQLSEAIDAAEAEAFGDGPAPLPEEASAAEYSWWDVLLGKHDHAIFESFANTPVERDTKETQAKAKHDAKAKMRATAVIGVEHQMPRFWVLTDHGREQIILVLRGTMSFNEIAVDLTCETEDFEPAKTTEGEPPSVPGHFAFPTGGSSAPELNPKDKQYHVHGGMLRMAKAMGCKDRPVQLAVREALMRNPGYELVLCGHSLGAGVAGILGMMWADPTTCLTVNSNGLPPGRHASVYLFAPPCITDAALSRLASDLIVSFVYSNDVVSRLSLGSVQDIRNAAMWLCEANDHDNGAEGYCSVTDRAQRWKAGRGSPHDPDWFIAVRKTLEASMQIANLYPPGRVLWAMRNSDMHPSHRKITEPGGSPAPSADKLHLFEVLDAEKVFSQIVFARDMLSSHMPHTYDSALHDLL